MEITIEIKSRKESKKPSELESTDNSDTNNIKVVETKSTKLLFLLTCTQHVHINDYYRAIPQVLL